MLQLLALATLAVSASTAPIADISVKFTSDSVYKYESIISPKELIEQEDGKYTIILEKDHLLGYTIYDNKDTDYLDGLKFDDQFVSAYTIKDVDLSVEHTILVKTVYTDDVAGMLASAKDGDWSRALANPVILFQLFYYLIAAVSIILGGFGLFKSKKKKAKTSAEIAAEVAKQSLLATDDLKSEAIGIVNSTVAPTLGKMQDQMNNIIKAFMLAQSGTKEDKLALLNLLQSTANEDVGLLSSTITQSIEEATALKEKAKEEGIKTIKQLSEGTFETKDDIGGISI